MVRTKGFAAQRKPAHTVLVNVVALALLMALCIVTKESQAASTASVVLSMNGGTTVFTPETVYIDLGGTVTWTKADNSVAYSIETVPPGVDLNQSYDYWYGQICSGPALEHGPTYAAKFDTMGCTPYEDHMRPWSRAWVCVGPTLPPHVITQITKPAGSGLQYKYYECTGVEWDSAKDLSTMTPVKTGTTDSFNVGMRLRTYKFAVHFSGAIEIPADGDYTFNVYSDAGADLYLGDYLAIHNTGHNAITFAKPSPPLALKKGYYAITADYYMDSTLTGGALRPGFMVSYQSNTGIAATKIPKSILFSAPLAVRMPGAIVQGFANSLTSEFSGHVLTVTVGFAAPHQLEVVTPSGAVAARYFGAGATTYRFNRGMMPAGVFLLRAISADGSSAAKMVTLY
ncbi:MAG: PA14 domain-containing protein [Chitinivibrionales bacterium]|nr:PA14 domain-containing protein [Chitinivibrionales bacterium]